MDREQLNKKLAQVQSELRNADWMDVERRKALQETADDIYRMLDKEGDHSAGLNHLASRLKSQIAHLEAKHPNLTLAIGELADALSKIGV